MHSGYEIVESQKKCAKIADEPSFNFYIFDPASNGASIRTNLLGGSAKWKRQLKRGLHTVKKKEYQVVYVEGGIMTAHERLASKDIVSKSF